MARAWEKASEEASRAEADRARTREGSDELLQSVNGESLTCSPSPIGSATS